MGGSEDGKSSKSEKSSPSVSPTKQTGVHVYPEWAAMQAYYGPRAAMPPYYNPAVASGHPPPPFMWGPQPMMSPYGIPYAAIYASGGVYAHPAVPLGTTRHGQGVSSPAVSEPPVAIPLTTDTPSETPGNADKCLMKKLKEFDGLAMSIGNSNMNIKVEGSAEIKMSQSAATDGSNDGSDKKVQEVYEKKKRSREEALSDGEDEQVESKPLLPTTDKVLGTPITPVHIPTALELLSPGIDVKRNSTSVTSNTVVSPEIWIQNERELKRERRKQANRDSARRSRLRRQAVAEEFGRKVNSLSAEKTALELEINHFSEKSKQLRLENASLMEKLKNLQSEEKDNVVDVKLNPTDSTENLLSRVNNSGHFNTMSEEGTEKFEKSSKSKGSKFHQLLSTSPRADVVAAS